MEERCPSAPRGGPVGAGGGEAEDAARRYLVGPRQGVGAETPACLGAGQAVVEALQQPGLEAARVVRTGQPLQHRCRGHRPGHRRTAGVDVGGEQSSAAQVVGG